MPPRPTPQSDAATLPAASPLDPFDEAELQTYKAPPPHEDSTVLVPQRAAEPRDHLYWLLAVLGVLGLIAIVVVFWLTSRP